MNDFLEDNLKNNFKAILNIAAVFIGTIVGAGLASGQEITQFFTSYGPKSFLGILICFMIYSIMSYFIVKISIKYKLKSYKSLIKLVSPGILGLITDLSTSFFLVCSAAIIMAGSGALLHQYFGISPWIGILLMCTASIFTLFKDTKGLLEINSFIVPSLIIVITTIFLLYIIVGKTSGIALSTFSGDYKNFWFIACILYGGFNILCCSGVLVPLSTEINKAKTLILGCIIGAAGLTVLSSMINYMLLLNMPNIFKYDIPLLYIAHRFGAIVQIMLLAIIWLEMFSTEVSDIYSVGKTLKEAYNISYKKSVILIILIAIPISGIGFSKLIRFLYPGFGVISIIFMVQCIIFYFKKYKYWR